MKKIVLGVLSALAITVVLVSAGMALGSIKIVIDGKTVTSLKPRLENGQIIINAEALAKAMQADARWDKQSSTLQINRELTPDQIRVDLLENALDASSPEAAAKAWAQAVQSRNGAWQYALLDSDLRSKKHDDYVGFNWVTGSSSPWVESYRVTPYHPEQSKAIQYQVDYYYATSYSSAGQSRELLTLVNQAAFECPPHWKITAVDTLPVPEIKGISFENRAQLDKWIIFSGVPTGWQLKSGSSQLLILDNHKKSVGNIEVLGGNYLPNHSQAVKKETLNGVYGEGQLVLLNLIQPAASGIKTSQLAVYALVPGKEKYWLQLSMPCTQATADKTLTTARNIAGTLMALSMQ